MKSVEIALVEQNEPDERLVSVVRTMQVLQMLSSDERGQTLAQIARSLDVNKSIALRILSTLVAENYLYKKEDGQYYALTYKLSTVGLRSLISNRLFGQIQPRLRAIAEVTGELVLFSLVSGDGPHWVLSAMGSARRRLQVEPSMKMVLHSSASGKGWLATLPDEEIIRILGDKLEATTSRTKVSLDAILADISVIRQTGASYSDQENEEGIKAVAVPVWREMFGQRRCIAFISITAPISRVSDADFARFESILKEAAIYVADVWPLDETEHMSYTLLPR